MDPERQIRFLYPPLFLVASLVWGLHLDPSKALDDLIPLQLFGQNATSMLTVIAGGGIVLIVAFGLLIGSLSHTVLRIAAMASKRDWAASHEAMLSDEALENIQVILAYPRPRKSSDTLFLAATFDHDKLPKPIHAWLLRRWNAFNVSVSSVFAVALAPLVGGRLGISVQWEWILTSAVIGVVFAVIGCWAWRDTMKMLDFQARLLRPGISGVSTSPMAAPVGTTTTP